VTGAWSLVQCAEIADRSVAPLPRGPGGPTAAVTLFPGVWRQGRVAETGGAEVVIVARHPAADAPPLACRLLLRCDGAAHDLAALWRDLVTAPGALTTTGGAARGGGGAAEENGPRASSRRVLSVRGYAPAAWIAALMRRVAARAIAPALVRERLASLARSVAAADEASRKSGGDAASVRERIRSALSRTPIGDAGELLAAASGNPGAREGLTAADWARALRGLFLLTPFDALRRHAEALVAGAAVGPSVAAGASLVSALASCAPDEPAADDLELLTGCARAAAGGLASEQTLALAVASGAPPFALDGVARRWLRAAYVGADHIRPHADAVAKALGDVARRSVASCDASEAAGAIHAFSPVVAAMGSCGFSAVHVARVVDALADGRLRGDVPPADPGVWVLSSHYGPFLDAFEAYTSLVAAAALPERKQPSLLEPLRRLLPPDRLPSSWWRVTSAWLDPNVKGGLGSAAADFLLEIAVWRARRVLDPAFAAGGDGLPGLADVGAAIHACPERDEIVADLAAAILAQSARPSTSAAAASRAVGAFARRPAEDARRLDATLRAAFSGRAVPGLHASLVRAVSAALGGDRDAERRAVAGLAVDALALSPVDHVRDWQACVAEHLAAGAVRADVWDAALSLVERSIPDGLTSQRAEDAGARVLAFVECASGAPSAVGDAGQRVRALDVASWGSWPAGATLSPIHARTALACLRADAQARRDALARLRPFVLADRLLARDAAGAERFLALCTSCGVEAADASRQGHRTLRAHLAAGLVARAPSSRAATDASADTAAVAAIAEALDGETRRGRLASVRAAVTTELFGGLQGASSALLQQLLATEDASDLARLAGDLAASFGTGPAAWWAPIVPHAPRMKPPHLRNLVRTLLVGVHAFRAEAYRVAPEYAVQSPKIATALALAGIDATLSDEASR